MFHSERKNFYLFRAMIVLLVSIIFFSSCTTLPKFPAVPKNFNQTKMATIKLITVNEEGFNEQFGGSHREMTFVFPFWTKAGSIVFNDEYVVYADGDWESSNGKFFNARFKFNDNAVFRIPAGVYKLCIYKMSDFGSSSNPVVLKNCYDNSPFQFDAGGNYEMYVYYSNMPHEDYRSNWRMAITDIRKVKEFKPTPIIFNNN
jgi:hypothetical protein